MKTTEKNQEQYPVKERLKKSVRCKPDEYKLIFHSRSILFSQAIAQYLYEELKIQKTTTLLLDLKQEEIDQIFNEIICKRSLQLLKNPFKPTKIQMVRLNQVTKQKRSEFYKTPGIFSLSKQVFLTDLIRHQKIIQLQTINRIIIRISQKITSYLNYYGWIFTLLKKQTKYCSVIILCRQVQYYTQFQVLEGIYRTFFCSKLMIWPFGRSQVHKSIQKAAQKIREQKHYLQMTEQMKKNEELLKKLLQFVQKEYNRFRTHKIKGLEILMNESVGQQLQQFGPQQFQTRDFRNMKFLMNCVQNYESIDLISFLLGLRHSDIQKSIWNSNNSTVCEIFEEIQNNCKSHIFTIQKIEEQSNFIKVDLAELIVNYHQEREEKQIAERYSDWEGIYELNYKIKPSPKRNHKVIETCQIINKILAEIYEKQIQKETLRLNKNKESSQDKSEQYFLRNLDIEEQLRQRLLINCPNQTAQRYLHKQLFTEVNKSHYIESLRSVFKFLQIQRQLRITNIKSMYNKIKTKKLNPKMEIQQLNYHENHSIQNQSPLPNDTITQNCPNYRRSSSGLSQSSSQMLKTIDAQLYKQQQKPQNDNSSKKQEKSPDSAPLIPNTVSQTQKGQNSPKQNQHFIKQAKKTKKPFKQIFKENITILQECLYKQLTIFFDILANYQNQVFSDEQIRMNISNKKNLNNPKKYQQNQLKQEKNVFQLNLSQQKQDSLQILMKGQSLAFQSLFQQQISRINFNFIDKSQLKVVPNYSQTSEISFYSKINPSKKVLIVSLFSSKPSCEDKVTSFNRAMKLINPQHVIFYTPHSWQIRNLYLSFSQGLLTNLKQIDVLAFKNSFEVLSAQHQVKTEDEAFWKISQNRLRLSEYKENPQMRIKDLNMNDKYQKTIDFINFAIKNDVRTQEKLPIYQIGFNQRRVIIDTREFRSSLPCQLFFAGFTIIPIQLETADYILSDHIGIEKKSIHTKDLQQSLKSFRIDKQIKRMCQKFQKPYLLIECQNTEDFKKQSFYQRGLPNTPGKDSYRVYVRQRLAQLMKKYPRLRILWSQSVSKSCEFFKQLKRDQPQPQIGKYMKNENEQNEKTKLLESQNQSSDEEKERSQMKFQQ